MARQSPLIAFIVGAAMYHSLSHSLNDSFVEMFFVCTYDSANPTHLNFIFHFILLCNA